MRRSPGIIDHSHHCPPPYSLPQINQVSGQDDWTAAKDRTTKKRIQNRVAQRTYRQRTKERIADLQTKLANYERERRSREGGDQGCAGNSSRSPMQRSDGPANVEAVEQDIVAFSTFLLGEEHDRTGGTRNDEGLEGSGGTEGEHALSGVINSQPGSLTLGDGDGDDLTSYLSAGCESWEPSAFTGPSQQEPWRDNVLPGDHRNGRPSFWVPPDMDTAKPTSYDDTSRLASRPGDTNVDERIKCILSYLETLGFENFDELARIYYGHSFDEASFLHGEQRLSRNRRLPGVIASVFSAAAKWTPWERRGFQEEILKATEAVLISESLEAQTEIQSRVSRLLKTPRTTVPDTASMVLPLKESITSKLPNLWALMMTLAASTNPPKNKDFAGKALATLLILQCAGRMEKRTLLGLIGSCL